MAKFCLMILSLSADEVGFHRRLGRVAYVCCVCADEQMKILGCTTNDIGYRAERARFPSRFRLYPLADVFPIEKDCWTPLWRISNMEEDGVRDDVDGGHARLTHLLHHCLMRGYVGLSRFGLFSLRIGNLEMGVWHRL